MPQPPNKPFPRAASDTVIHRAAAPAQPSDSSPAGPLRFASVLLLESPFTVHRKSLPAGPQGKNMLLPVSSPERCPFLSPPPVLNECTFPSFGFLPPPGMHMHDAPFPLPSDLLAPFCCTKPTLSPRHARQAAVVTFRPTHPPAPFPPRMPSIPSQSSFNLTALLPPPPYCRVRPAPFAARLAAPLAAGEGTFCAVSPPERSKSVLSRA